MKIVAKVRTPYVSSPRYPGTRTRTRATPPTWPTARPAARRGSCGSRSSGHRRRVAHARRAHQPLPRRSRGWFQLHHRDRRRPERRAHRTRRRCRRRCRSRSPGPYVNRRASAAGSKPLRSSRVVTASSGSLLTSITRSTPVASSRAAYALTRSGSVDSAGSDPAAEARPGVVVVAVHLEGEVPGAAGRRAAPVGGHVHALAPVDAEHVGDRQRAVHRRIGAEVPLRDDQRQCPGRTRRSSRCIRGMNSIGSSIHDSSTYVGIPQRPRAAQPAGVRLLVGVLVEHVALRVEVHVDDVERALARTARRASRTWRRNQPRKSSSGPVGRAGGDLPVVVPAAHHRARSARRRARRRGPPRRRSRYLSRISSYVGHAGWTS